MMKIDLSNYQDYALYYDSAVAIYATAATECNAYTEKVCGFSFAVNQTAKHFIFIGRSPLSQTVIDGFENACLQQDGYRIAVVDGNVYIYGNTKQATYFGVCTFIERVLGVRWLNIDTTYVPVKEYMEIAEEELVQVPYFPQRIFYTAQSLALNPENTSEKSAQIAAHQKMRFPDKNLEGFLGIPHLWNNRMPDPHNSTYYVSPERYQREHPEFFVRSPMGAVDLCYSNGVNDEYGLDEEMELSVVKATAETLYRSIKEKPEIEFYSFGKQDDRTALCQCPTCVRRREELGGESGVMMAFFNAVIQRTEALLQKDGLDVDFKIVTLAYQHTEEPPVKDGKPVHAAVVPSPRLHVRYAPISADYTYSLTDVRQKEEVRKQLLGWATLTNNIMIWDYQDNYTEYCWYFPNLRYLKENLQTYADIGVSYLFNQAAYNINRHWQDEMRSYIASKLYWDLSLDVTTLRNEYIRLLYGVAAEEVEELVDKMEDFFAQKVEKGFHVELFVADKEYFNPKEYPVAFLLDCIALIERGLEKVKGADYGAEEKEKRIKDLSRVLLTPLRMLAKNVGYYFPNQETDYERRVFETAKLVGLTKLGEGVPLFVDVVKAGECKHKIVLGQEFTEREKRAALLLQKELRALCGITLEIVKDDKVFPAYNEHALCIGNGMMFREFYKGTVNMDEYEYYIDVRGRCAFIFGAGDLDEAVKLFVRQLLVDGKEVVLPAIKKERKREKEYETVKSGPRRRGE